MVVVGYFFLREQSARAELQDRIEAMQANGLPTDNPSMAKFHAQGASEECGEAWAKIVDAVTSNEFEQSGSGVPLFDAEIVEVDVVPGQPWEHEQSTRSFLELHRQIIRDAVGLGLDQLEPDALPARFPVQFDSFNTLLPYTQHMRQVARLLSLRTSLAIYDRDSVGTRRNVLALFGASKALAHEPFLVSQLVTLAIEGMAVGHLQEAIEYDVLTENDLEALLEFMLSRVDVSTGWRRAMHGERAMALEALKNPQQFGAAGFSFNAGSSSLKYLEVTDSALEIPTDDLNSMMIGIADVQASVQGMLNGSPLEVLETTALSSMLPTLDSAALAFIRNAMRSRLTALGLAVRLFEKREGRFPTDLNELQVTLDLPNLDPVGNKPFGFRVEPDNSVTLWGFEPRTTLDTPKFPPNQAGNLTPLDEMWLLQLPASTSQKSDK